MFLEEKRQGEAPALAEWQQHLLQAADLLEKQGWCQRNIRNEFGEHCLVGAMSAVSSNSNTWAQTRLAINRYLDKHYPGYVNRIDWNNAPGRTKEEVVRCLRSAAQE